MTRRRSSDVAIYAPLAGALYEPGDARAGGAELQSFYLARSLAKAGLRVRHVVLSRRPPLVLPDGVEIVTIPRPYERGKLARRRAVVRSLREADASVYVQRSAGFETGLVGLFSRTARRRFVFSSSSEADFDLRPDTARAAGASLDEWPTRVQYRIGLRCAHRVIVQTSAQRDLARGLGVEARVVPSFCVPADETRRGGEAFLWIGGIVDFKDPLAYVELAATVPDVPFWMVPTDRGASWRALGEVVRERAAAVPNLELLPPRGREELFELYRRAVAVVNTSRFEGFPNTFLEAWARGTPVLSLAVDPDGVISRHGLGAVAGGSIEQLARAVRWYWQRRSEYASFAQATRRYIAEVHDPAVVGPQWAEVLRELLDG